MKEFSVTTSVGSFSEAPYKAARAGRIGGLSSERGDAGLGAAAAELILRQISEDPRREELLRTPERFAKVWDEICSGYDQTAAKVIGEGVFSAESNGLVTVNNIECFSICEHHMLPFWGQLSVAE